MNILISFSKKTNISLDASRMMSIALKNKGRHGTDPWSQRILPLLKLDVPSWNRRPHDHGIALQAEDHGKKILNINTSSTNWIKKNLILL